MKDHDFKEHLLHKYSIKKHEINHDTLTELYPANDDGSPNLDAGFRLVGNGATKEWKLYEIQRDQKFLIAVFPREEVGIFALYLGVKGKFEQEETDIDRQTKSSLRRIDNPAQGLALLEQQLDDGLFSFDKEIQGSINILKGSTDYNVCYISFLGKTVMITKNRSMQSAFSVAYNYCKLLETFLILIKDGKESLHMTLKEEEELKRVFLGK